MQGSGGRKQSAGTGQRDEQGSAGPNPRLGCPGSLAIPYCGIGCLRYAHPDLEGLKSEDCVDDVDWQTRFVVATLPPPKAGARDFVI